MEVTSFSSLSFRREQGQIQFINLPNSIYRKPPHQFTAQSKGSLRNKIAQLQLFILYQLMISLFHLPLPNNRINPSYTDKDQLGS